jgi:hypothetical protein
MEEKIEAALEILMGLYQLQKETEQKYILLLRHLPGMGGDISSVFERIVESCSSHAKELKTVLEIHSDLFNGSVDSKPTLAQLHELNERKNILEYCIKDIKAITNAYSIALSWKGTESVAGNLILRQMEELTRLHEHIKHFSEAA